ncbi:Zn-ribbon domain-containing OB-fold protein [Simplicispira metamorpha]|uniref:Zn-ribbon domain-containing OB-fold protein n=1 Tax=Simplicispira metamorpha TaxID=80881 RepID=UPI000E5C4C73|nr:bifunctional MaoC family dehydratase N-terminal/OB-fold nucleic acid binding domain-containing protein [Simplicispira metamorpha]
MAEHEWMNEVRALVGKEYGRVYAWDKINAPMIRQWCEVMGVDATRYTAEGAVIAPPAMLQVWCMEGPVANNYPPGSTTENPYEALKLLEAQGMASVVAVNSELTFGRDVREGERLYYTTRLDSISPEKTTALGTGYFVTLVMAFFSEQPQGDEEVGQLLFRVFKFRPANPVKPATDKPAAPVAAKRPLPGISDDTRFFWDGARAGKLLIQRCKGCGELRHPPGPVCPSCHSFEWDTVEASGRGTVYSFVVMHYPEVPPFDHLNPIVLVELEEGTRLISQIVGIQPGEVRIGQAVQVEFNSFNDGELVLPQFRPVAAAAQGVAA